MFAPDEISKLLKELHALAQLKMQRERPDHTLQPTALVNETYLRLVRGKPINAAERTHILAVAAKVMRQILIDHARSHRAAKREGAQERVELQDFLASATPKTESLLMLNEVLERLAEFAPRQARVVELMYFGGLTEQEVAEELDLDVRTIKRDWAAARAWLQAELNRKAN